MKKIKEKRFGRSIAPLLLVLFFISCFTSCNTYSAMYVDSDFENPDKVMRGEMTVVNGVEVRNPVEVFRSEQIRSVDFLAPDGRYLVTFKESNTSIPIVAFFTEQNVEYKRYTNSDLKPMLNSHYPYSDNTKYSVEGAYYRSLDTIVLNVQPYITHAPEVPMEKVSLLVNPLNDVVYDTKTYDIDEYPNYWETFDETAHAFPQTDFYPYEDVRLESRKIYFKNQQVDGLPDIVASKHFDYFRRER